MPIFQYTNKKITSSIYQKILALVKTLKTVNFNGKSGVSQEISRVWTFKYCILLLKRYLYYNIYTYNSLAQLYLIYRFDIIN